MISKEICNRVHWWIALVIISAVNYGEVNACFVQYPTSAHYPDEGVIRVVYNFSPWDIKVLLLGEPLSHWTVLGGVVRSDHDVLLPRGITSMWSVLPPIHPQCCRFFIESLQQLDGIKFQVITKQFTKDVDLVDSCVKDFTIFILQRRIERKFVGLDHKDIEERYFLNLYGLNNDCLVHLGPRGMHVALVSVTWDRLKNRLPHMPPIKSWCISRRIIKSIAPVPRSSRRSGHPVPLLLTPDEIARIEHMSIHDADESRVPSLLLSAVAAIEEEDRFSRVSGWASARSEGRG